MDADQQEKATLGYPSEEPHVAAEDVDMDPPANPTPAEEQQQSDITEPTEQQQQQPEEAPAPDADAAVTKEEQEEEDKEKATDGKEESHHDEEVITTMTTDQEPAQDAAGESEHALEEASASPIAPTEPATATFTADQDPMDVMETSVDTFTTAASNENNQDTEEYTPMEGVAHQNDDAASQPEVAAAVNDAPPFLSAPASWQIPVAALHQQQQQQKSEPQHQQPPVSSKATMRKERYESRVKDNTYDVEAWTWLINEAQQTGDLEVIRDMYERFLNVFPTSVSVYARKRGGSIDMEMGGGKGDEIGVCSDMVH